MSNCGPSKFEVVAAAVDPHQRQLFARKAQIRFPQASPSADSLGEVEADDGHRYYIKGDAHGRLVRASEWVCSQLAEVVGVATPGSAVIELEDGSMVFGSRRIAGVADEVVTRTFLATSSTANADGQSQTTALQQILSRIYAFDLFASNGDRHLGNYLSVDDLGRRRIYAFDFSRAFFWDWPWRGHLAEAENTRLCGRLLRHLHGFDTQAASGILDRLQEVSTPVMGSLFTGMPDDWCPKGLQLQFLDWWDSGQHVGRSEEIRKGLTDGSLL